MNRSKLCSLLVLLATVRAALAFNGHVVTEGPLTLRLAEVAVVTNFNTPQPVAVTLSNAGPAALEVALELRGLVDDCRAVGETKRRVSVPAGGQAGASFQFACGRGCYSAHYPVHVYAAWASAGQPATAHAVLIVETDFRAAVQAEARAADWAVTAAPAAGALALADLKTQRVAWSYINEPLVLLPVGWSGSDATSAASFIRQPVTRGGESKAALQMHPPYRPRAGTVFVEYRLKLPATQPVRLTFCNAIRDSTPKEGFSDGVTFRVWVGGQKLFERHTDSKVWLPGEADLSALAGKEIVLRLESHPGPKNNTSCDSSYWGEPTVMAGAPPKMQTAEGKAALQERARQALASGQASGLDLFVFDLEGGCRAVVASGPNGLADGVIGFGSGGKTVFFDGLYVTIGEQVVGAWPSGVRTESVNWQAAAGKSATLRQGLRMNDKTFDLTVKLFQEGPALRIKVDCSENITGLALKAADQKAPRVFYGHGYAIADPEPFRASAGGHNMASSHVACDFERGVSLLMATDTPPDYFRVNPPERLYQLHTHPGATLTFVPGLDGAFDCAVKYRPLYDKKAAPGVARKAGRFVFDLWGGRYADDAARLARCFDYGLTNSLTIMHVWQRWGYDYRLPDIFPPDPKQGTLEDLRELGRVCTERGALWGLHDNYIDIYPDATDFSYNLVTFGADGSPRRAWLNEGREAQSYQYRPDRFAPLLKRNWDLIVPALHPSASFVDVFTSANSFDYYDREGKFHSRLETQQRWGEGFAAIREACGNNAPTSSEAGSDQLVGWLDGADCQFMQLSAKSAPFHNTIICRDWDRVPWFDAVNHTRFSLHGVGYSGRYEGGRSRDLHGIDSDDYISAELLTGHALMTDLSSLGRGAVRKHWLAQEFIESIARDEIARVEFAEGNFHRLIVSWKSGARVWVNRGEADWTVAGHTLPQFGYFAKNGEIESSIERLGGLVAEQSRARGKFYVNGRGFQPNAPLAITPRAGRVEYLGERKFRLLAEWDAQRPAPKDLSVFYHFSRPTPGRRAMTEFVSGGLPKSPTTQWQGRVATGSEWTISIPTNMPVGEYEILVGLAESKGRSSRVRLLGDEDSSRRYRIGKLIIDGNNKTNITAVRLEKPEQEFVPNLRALANTAPVDFGTAATRGAFRCEARPGQLLLTPLPDGEEFELGVRLDRATGRATDVRSVEALDRHGEVVRTVAHQVQDGALKFTALPTDFSYRANLR